MNDAAAYVHYGCGLCAPATWTNFDASPTLRLQRVPLLGKLAARGGPRFPGNARYGDIVRGLPVAPGSCRAVYCSHVLEHLSLEDLRTALRHTHQCLAPGGTFRFVLPDLGRLAREYVESRDPQASIRFLEKSLLGVPARARGLRAFVRQWLGNSQHLWMWDERSLRAELEAAGFTGVRRAKIGDSRDPRFADVEEPHRWEDCLGMECVRPGSSMKTVAPFFIVGTGRSGTTLLQAMFMASGGIFIPPETHFLPLSDRAQRRAGPPSTPGGLDALIGEVLAMCERQEMPVDPAALQAELRSAPPTRGDLFDALLDHVKRRQPGCRRIAEKSPVHLPYADELLRIFPDGKVITIIRDGRDVALSHEQSLDRGTLRAALRWRSDQRLHARWARTLPGDRYAWVRYEDLVTGPEPHLRRLCEFLGEPFDERMLRPHERGDSGFATWETHKALTREPVTTARIGRYKAGLSRAQVALFQAICRRELLAHGYALEPISRLAGLPLALRQAPDLALSQLRRRGAERT